MSAPRALPRACALTKGALVGHVRISQASALKIKKLPSANVFQLQAGDDVFAISRSHNLTPRP